MSKKNPSAVAEYVSERRTGAAKAAADLAQRALGGKATDEDIEALEDAIEDESRYASMEKSLVKVTSEPDRSVYRRGGEFSYVRDFVAAGGQVGALGGMPASTTPFPGVDPLAAQARLRRHREETKYVRTVHNRDAERAAAKTGAATSGSGTFTANDGSIPQQRAGDLNMTDGDGGEFVPPAWLVNAKDYASVARSAAPVSSAIGAVPLPDGVNELFFPQLTNATEPVEPQNGQNTAISGTEGTESSSVHSSVPVVMVPVASDVSLQFLERGGPAVDEILMAEWQEALWDAIETQVINGSGSSGQATGLVNASNLISVTASPTADGYEYVAALGDAAAQVSDARLRPCEALVLRPGRFTWLASAGADGEGEPIIRPGTGLVPSNNDLGAYGPVAGLPVFQSGVIPKNLGTGTNQDYALAVRLSDYRLYVSSPVIDYFPDASGRGEQLTVRVGAHVYIAFVPDRYVSTAQLTGPTYPSGD